MILHPAAHAKDNLPEVLLKIAPNGDEEDVDTFPDIGAAIADIVGARQGQQTTLIENRDSFKVATT